MKFRKKPVIVEAVQCDDAILGAQRDWESLPDWLVAAYDEGKIVIGRNQIYISTLEGQMTANRKDWIIQGVAGELYPCKPDIFNATYEPAPAEMFDMSNEPVRSTGE